MYQPDICRNQQQKTPVVGPCGAWRGHYSAAKATLKAKPSATRHMGWPSRRCMDGLQNDTITGCGQLATGARHGGYCDSYKTVNFVGNCVNSEDA